jgi:hypothetical protein
LRSLQWLSRDGFRLTGGLAKPNAVLEQIWNKC